MDSLKITFDNFSLELHDNEYYEVTVFDDKEFKVEDLKKLVDVQKTLGELRLPVLVICSESALTDSDLLRTLSKNANNPFSKADAFVIKSMAQKILANFYLKINSPERPTKFFNNREEAYNWIKEYL